MTTTVKATYANGVLTPVEPCSASKVSVTGPRLAASQPGYPSTRSDRAAAGRLVFVAVPPLTRVARRHGASVGSDGLATRSDGTPGLAASHPTHGRAVPPAHVAGRPGSFGRSAPSGLARRSARCVRIREGALTASAACRSAESRAAAEHAYGERLTARPAEQQLELRDVLGDREVARRPAEPQVGMPRKRHVLMHLDAVGRGRCGHGSHGRRGALRAVRPGARELRPQLQR